MEILLTPELAQFVEETVKNGRYRSVSDLINRAVALLKDEEELRGVELDEVRALVAAGVEEADRDEMESWSSADIKAEGRRLLAERSKKR